MNDRKSIFQLERRIGLKDAYDGIIDNLRETLVASQMYSVRPLLECLLLAIRTWPYRDGSLTVENYAKFHGFLFNGKSNEDMCYTIELLLNLYYWFIRYESIQRTVHSGRGNATSPVNECQQCMENIYFLLEQVNYVVRESIINDIFPQYVISSRDVDVDAVLDAEPELAETLLAYLDFRNQNIEAKKHILNQIARFLEPKRKLYNDTCYSKVCDNLFYVFNNCGIRHNNDKQLELTDVKQIEICDKTFKAAVHLLQKEKIDEFQQIVKELKKH